MTDIPNIVLFGAKGGFKHGAAQTLAERLEFNPADIAELLNYEREAYPPVDARQICKRLSGFCCSVIVLPEKLFDASCLEPFIGNAAFFLLEPAGLFKFPNRRMRGTAKRLGAKIIAAKNGEDAAEQILKCVLH